MIYIYAPFEISRIDSGSKIRVEGILNSFIRDGFDITYIGLIDHNIDIFKAKKAIRSRYNISRVILFPHKSSILKILINMLLFRMSYRRAKFIDKNVALFFNSLIIKKKDSIWVNFFENISYCETFESTQVIVDLHNDDMEWYRQFIRSNRFVSSLFGIISSANFKNEINKYKNIASTFVYASESDRISLSPKLNNSNLCGFTIPNMIFGSRYIQNYTTSIKDRSIDILFIGSVQVSMNFDAARFLISGLKKTSKLGCNIVIAGRGASSLNNKTGYNNVEFIESPESVIDLYKNAKIFAMPFSKGSGSKLKLLEGSVSGCHIVSTAEGACGNEDKITALINICTLEDFDKAIHDLLLGIRRNSLYREEERFALHKHVMSQYNWNNLSMSSFLEQTRKDSVYVTDD